MKIKFYILLSTFFLHFLSFSNLNSMTLSSYLSQPHYPTTGAIYNLDDVKNNIKNILIVCPALVSGGPEALCQLYYNLNQQGFNTSVVWFKSFNDIQKKEIGGAWFISKQTIDLTPNVFKQKYNIKYLDYDFYLNDSNLVIIPEIMGDCLSFFNPAKKAFYWLSVPNFEVSRSNNICKTFITNNNIHLFDCLHLSDAPWISKQLKAWNINPILIEAPICQKYLENAPTKMEKTDVITFNPAKGEDLANKYASLNPNNHYIPIKGLSVDGVMQLLDQAKIYIDFGHFPGKDRIPREALARNCIIFLHHQNCGSDYDSFPIDDYFRFTEQDILDGTLQQKVEYALNNFEETHNKQSYARNLLNNEQEKFEQQIANLLGKPLSWENHYCNK